MVQSRRNVLQAIIHNQDSTNASLWLDKYINQAITIGDIKAEKEIVKEVVSINENPIYSSFFDKRDCLLESLGAKSKVATVSNRMAINLGAESVLETDIALDHTFGLPFIPGSALKGLTAFYARTRLKDEDWGIKSDAYKIIFGDSDNAGFVTFFDAYYIPNSGFERKAIYADIMTPHHTDYYQGKKNSPPADWDNPTPINFLTATGSYEIFILGEEELINAVFNILEHALSELGIGAKTSSGYGRMYFGEKKNYSEYYQIPNFHEEKHRLLQESITDDRKRNEIRIYRKEAGYGFLKTKFNGKDIYFEDKFFHEENIGIEEGSVVEFTIGKSDKGEPQAWDIVVLLAPY